MHTVRLNPIRKGIIGNVGNEHVRLIKRGGAKSDGILFAKHMVTKVHKIIFHYKTLL